MHIRGLIRCDNGGGHENEVEEVMVEVEFFVDEEMEENDVEIL